MCCFPFKQNFAIDRRMDAQTLLEQTRDRLRTHEGSYAEIARQSATFSYSWLSKVAQGKIDNPTVTSLQQLIDALDAFEAAQMPPPPPSPSPSPTNGAER